MFYLKWNQYYFFYIVYIFLIAIFRPMNLFLFFMYICNFLKIKVRIKTNKFIIFHSSLVYFHKIIGGKRYRAIACRKRRLKVAYHFNISSFQGLSASFSFSKNSLRLISYICAEKKSQLSTCRKTPLIHSFFEHLQCTFFFYFALLSCYIKFDSLKVALTKSIFSEHYDIEIHI